MKFSVYLNEAVKMVKDKPKNYQCLEIYLQDSIFQGYGLTETCNGQVLQELYDHKLESVGRPMTGAEVGLINWEERNYKVTDKPNPRGEIILGGDSTAKVSFDIAIKNNH